MYLKMYFEEWTEMEKSRKLIQGGFLKTLTDWSSNVEFIRANKFCESHLKSLILLLHND